jgi:membrane peptidoglycan carboxypeptidase
MASKLGIPPPYAEPSRAGLRIDGFDGSAMYDATAAWGDVDRFESIPPVVIRTLLYIENRELAEKESPYKNPAIDWPRFGKAVLLYGASRLGIPTTVEGGSTLAVQLEKYRHSPGGRTDSGVDKLRQMLSASLRVYREGPVTTDARKRIILDYVNTMPLAGAPGYGEVAGLEEGLRVWFGADPDRTFRDLRKGSLTKRARATKRVIAILCAVRAPTRYLISDHEALNARVNAYAGLLVKEGILDADLAEAVRKEPLRFAKKPGARVKPVVGRSWGATHPRRSRLDARTQGLLRARPPPPDGRHHRAPRPPARRHAPLPAAWRHVRSSAPRDFAANASCRRGTRERSSTACCSASARGKETWCACTRTT